MGTLLFVMDVIIKDCVISNTAVAKISCVVLEVLESQEGQALQRMHSSKSTNEFWKYEYQFVTYFNFQKQAAVNQCTP